MHPQEQQLTSGQEERNFGAELPKRRLESEKWTELTKQGQLSGSAVLAFPHSTGTRDPCLRETSPDLLLPYPSCSSLGSINRMNTDPFFLVQRPHPTRPEQGEKSGKASEQPKMLLSRV